jgi:HlyD family secretion protein
MTANLRIETDVRENALRVANAALRWRPPGTEPLGAQAQQRGGSGEAMMASERPPGADAGRGRGGRAMTAFAAALKKDLALTADQQTEVDAIVTGARKEMGLTFRSEADQNARRERLRTQWTAMTARIAGVLTDAQRTKFDALRERFAQERSARNATQRGRIYVLGEDGRPQAIDVRVGVSDGGVSEIITSALEPGREVITGGGPRVAEPAGAAPRRGRRFGF